MEKRAKLLVELLLDQDAEIGARDDAAMDLEEYDDAVVLNALALVGSNISEEPMIQDSCGESLAAIWVKVS